ncbi:hypothetical protein [Escherichia phage 18-1-2]|nr:hypothetical protein [Escherichia phage 18-1-2]UOX40148.1 hypothetical protein [Escherichia phage vB_EcoM_TH18]
MCKLIHVCLYRRGGVTIRKWSGSDNALDKSSVWIVDDICVCGKC